jgi:predicted nucleic acid-binding Zn ribbon protein
MDLPKWVSPSLGVACNLVNERWCARCGKPIPPDRGRRGAPAKYCSDRCRRRANEEQLEDESTEAGRLAIQHKLEHASYATRTCRCDHPLGVVDEDGEIACVRCAYPLARPSPAMFRPPPAA